METKYKTISDKFVFIPALDEIGSDIMQYRAENLLDLMNKALNTPGCVGFNTLGYLKSKINNLEPSRFFRETDGIYIMREDVVEEQKKINAQCDQESTLLNIMQSLCGDTTSSINTTESCSTSATGNDESFVKAELLHSDKHSDKHNAKHSNKNENSTKTELSHDELRHAAEDNIVAKHSKDRTEHTIQQIFKNDNRIMNDVFIETGSFTGDGIQAALDLGFKEIHSIELSEKYYNICKNRFKDYPNVFMHLGDSGEILESVIRNISDRLDEGITFWLDGHYSSMDTACAEKYCSPIQQELETIRKNVHPDHVILIDDMKDFTKESIKFNYVTNGKCGYIEKIELERILSSIHPVCNTYYYGPACISYSKNKL